MILTKRQKTLAGILVGLLLLIVATVVLVRSANRTSASDPARAPSDVAAVGSPTPVLSAIRLARTESYSRSVVHTGTVQTRNHTLVAFQRGGEIRQLLADEGQRVSPTQPLATLDNRHLTAQRDSLQARLNQASAVLAELQQGPRQESIEAARNAVIDLQEQLKAQQLRLKRSAELLKSNSIARQDYEQELYTKRGLDARLQAAQSRLDELQAGTRSEQIEAQQAQVGSIKAELQSVEYGLDDCHLTAPFAGMIVSRLMDQGAVVEAGTPVFELIDDLNLEVHVGVPQSVANQLRIGSACQVLAAGQEIEATLRVVLPRIDPATRTCKAIFDVKLAADREGTLYTGQLARVQLSQEIDEPGYWVPVTSLTADHSGLWSCYVVELQSPGGRQGLVRKQSVEILHQRDQRAYVRGTLQDGQVLVSDGMHRVVAGQKIQVQLDEEGYESVDLSAARTRIGH